MSHNCQNCGKEFSSEMEANQHSRNTSRFTFLTTFRKLVESDILIGRASADARVMVDTTIAPEITKLHQLRGKKHDQSEPHPHITKKKK